MPEEREDVEATLQQDTAPDTSQQKEKWRAIDRIAGGTFIAEVLWGLWWLITQVCRLIPWNPHVSTEHFAQFYCGVGLGILSFGYLILILWPIIFKQGKGSKQDNDPRWFHARILSSGIVGGSYAFLLPVVMSLPEGSFNSGGAAALRQAILLATGGLIGLIALGETRRKNDNDREAADNLRIHQQDTLDQQKEQFEKQLEKQQKQFEANAFKERKAERRERYTKAVEQLGDEKAPIRMGGVYTLVGLIDEWLEDDSIDKYEDRLKEGQVIINNLCAYIRSPFTLAARYDELSEDNPSSDGIYKDNQQKFYADKAEFKAEADVRLGIIKEIHDRLQDSGKNAPGAWSDFEYDFSGSTFFYPIDLTNSYYAKPINFRGSTYKGRADFSASTYRKGANFRNSTYKGRADFSDSTYKSWANFRNSTYKGRADFSDSTYRKGANFRNSTYKSWAYLSDSTYKSWANFRNSTYKDLAIFSASTYKDLAIFSASTYRKGANFRNSTYKDRADFSASTYRKGANFRNSTYKSWAYLSASTYKSWANFRNSTYKDRANFRNSTYKDRAIFSASTYKDLADFSASTYKDRADFSDSIYKDVADFSRSIFYSEIYFGYSTHSDSSSRFTGCAPQFYDETNRKNTLFGSSENNFTVENGRGYPIYRNLEGLPLGCKFLTSGQKEYLEGKLQEIEKINDKLFEVKDLEEKVELSKKLWSLNEELYEWREEATTV